MVLPPSSPELSALSGSNRYTGWALLAALQAAVAFALFHDYLFGDRFFAFVDIGSDTFEQFVPVLMHSANPANWASAWSFNVGLGAVLLPSLNPFALLGIAAGPEHVLEMRIWVYLAKLFAGGASFYAFISAVGMRRDIALMAALAYTFCGYVITDGQWDPGSTEFVLYALLLWAFARHDAQRNSWMIPLVVALAAYCGAFMVSVGVFVAYAFAAAAFASERPRATIVSWLRSILPQCVAGLLLAAPVLLPVVFLMLDSPRVTGAQSGFGDRLGELFSANDAITVLFEIAGMFHKNILGVGDQHTGWMNYLESPVFYVGMLPLLLIPQLWRGSQTDRRVLVAGGLTIGLFIAFPAVRYLAFGFGLDYFRVNNLWISILLLALFARALGGIFERGIHFKLLLGTGAAVLVMVLILLAGELRPVVSMPHAIKILAFLGVAMLLGLALGPVLRWRHFVLLALGLIAIEAVVINYPSFHAQRQAVTRQTPGYSDGTAAALAYLKARDPGFYRLEKTYNSVSFCDALAQGYMGVKSYWFQGASMVGFYTDLELLPRRSSIKNFTNWLPNFGNRFVLSSLAGVKYVLSRSPLDWPGFHPIHESGGLSVYENELALPLGVVYDQQFPRSRAAALPAELKDIAMINAVIVDSLRGVAPRVFDERLLERKGADGLSGSYFDAARLLQRRGMVVERFSHSRISGKIVSDVSGVLVFSIPYARGWSVAIDGVEQPVFSANLGMLATDIPPGEHRIELRYSLPGLIPGLLVGLFVILCIGALGVLGRRLPCASPSGPGS